MGRSQAPSLATRAALSITTPIAISAIALAALFNPVWIDMAQERAGVATISGWPEDEIQRITGSILADVIVGPPAFDVASGDGGSVLDNAERGHMRDVHSVLRGFVLLTFLAGGAGAVLLWHHRFWPAAWMAVSLGAAGLVVAGTVLAVLVVFFFDAAFLAFHLVFFPQGNFSFDPKVERLTQLFPARFWTESATAVVLLGVGLGIAVSLIARRQAQVLGNGSRRQDGSRTTP